jgi:DDE superfamily endonuclease
MLDDVYCFADVLKINIQSTADYVAQASNYNGWTHGHYISNVFFFAPDGTIIGSCVNCPGSFHDSMVFTIGGLYNVLENIYQHCGGKCVVDSAFCS